SSAAAIACQEFSVKPNELEKEKPYIDHSICFTRQAYDLDTIDEVFYEGTAKLNSSVLDSPTIKNIRILDYRPLSVTLNQQQALRLYYGMEFADVDRYYIDGEMTEVLVSTRELYQDKLPSKTWINKKLIYTHGNGIIINPVSKVTKEGLPELWVKDIPAQSNKQELNITQSQIYYGEVTDNYVITNSRQKEFDYPSGDENIYNTYDGSGGIYLSTALRKFIIGWRLDPVKIWLSDYITPNSRFHLHRNIDERVSKIAPYLYYDKDPHIFIGEEKLFWMMSGMVHTKNYPYSESFGNGNYIKDSVKIIIDAKNGTIEFFVIQNDPIIRTYQKIYPGLFKPLDSMPEEHQKHLKYPEDLFTLQTEKLDIYHMTSTEVFYNKEDKWQIGQEVHGLDEEQKVEAYNIILDLNNDAEFMLTLPLTPYDKQNLVAWFAVYQDPAKYGEKVLYKLSKEHLTYGPMQIESRISQDEEISAQMTLWNAGGSSVIRGNLLIIPISGSLLCVEPIYIVSSTKGSMPELKKIVAVYYDPVSDESKLAWDDSLEGAILKVIGEPDKRIEVVKKTIGGQEEIMMLIIYDRNDQEITRISIMENQSISLVST
ncbi:MAG: UPF0182 family protein, partial [Candidatus Pacebacteria bacterium]|nr:UPF0182 family protein [Candidatus Paceibacterota bacterium]